MTSGTVQRDRRWSMLGPEEAAVPPLEKRKKGEYNV
jgi:hypothetical protein